MPRLPIDLTSLEALSSIAETGSFSAAAEELGISQSAVSSRIRTAEEILGIELFHRTTRSVVITEQGARLKARADHTLSELRAILDEFKDEVRLIRGRVKVGATPTVSATILPDAVSRFSATNPGIKVTIHDDFFGQALERVASGEVDFALTPINRGKEFQHLQFEHLYAEKMVVIVPEEHPLTQENFSLAEMAKHELVSMPEQTASYHQIAQVFSDHGLPFEPEMQTMQALSMVALVRAGLAQCFVPIGILKFFNMTGLRVIHPKGIDVSRQIAIATTSTRNLSAAANAFIKTIKAQIGADTVQAQE